YNIKLTDTVYKDSPQKVLDFRIVSKDHYEPFTGADGIYSIRYKNTVNINDFYNVTNILPELSGINYSGRYDLPYFTAGLEQLAIARQAGEKTAVEGGPCLFGTDEVLVIVTRKGGQTDYFDYNTGKSYSLRLHSDQEYDFGSFMREHGSEVESIQFENRKTGLTPQEWIFIKYPFEAASVLNAPLVIPIPDMSYVKYLKAVLKYTSASVRERALNDFRDVSHEICDKYLQIIDKFKGIYRNVSCEVVHERNTALIDKYYKARSPYIERNKVLRSLTQIPEKCESVKDYISMPALPYYLYGIKNILEIDSMDETDSYRKCSKAHKGTINLSCLLLPEFLSKDKMHTIFDAPADLKEYGEYVIE
ncbi:MAG TPA: hypothetical protein IAB17_01655, partial [Candidatus Alectryocaccobium stercorigallinarum]|nr:hypothetical protein [Candidatus Alectryocaccobium stercorigallinarum]